MKESWYGCGVFFKHILLFVGRQVAIGGVRSLGIIPPSMCTKAERFNSP